MRAQRNWTRAFFFGWKAPITGSKAAATAATSSFSKTSAFPFMHFATHSPRWLAVLFESRLVIRIALDEKNHARDHAVADLFRSRREEKESAFSLFFFSMARSRRSREKAEQRRRRREAKTSIHFSLFVTWPSPLSADTAGALEAHPMMHLPLVEREQQQIRVKIRKRKAFLPKIGKKERVYGEKNRDLARRGPSQPLSTFSFER